MNQQLVILIVVVPLLASLLIMSAGWKHQWFAPAVSLAALFFCLAASVTLLKFISVSGSFSYWLGGWRPPFGIAFQIDSFNALILLLVSFLAFACAVYAKSSVESELPDRVCPFWCLYLLLITGLLGIIVTGDLFNLFVLLEVASLTGYALVAVGSRNATVAGFRYLVIGSIGACFYLLGVGYLYIATGTLNMADLAQILPDVYGTKPIITAFTFIVTGFGIKIALFPLHSWQPDAYTHAPSAVSIIISTAVAKTFAYALVRVIFSVFTIQFVKTVLPVFTFICWLAAAAIVVGSVSAIFQDNLKRVLAYSSIANVGYIVLGVGLAVKSSLGLTPAIMHMVNHALIKAAMFMAACGFIHKLGLHNISDFEGLSRKMPVSAMVLITASLAMIGLPPGGGFVSKWYLILAAIDAGQHLFVFVIFGSTLLMLVYFWRIIEIMYIRPPASGSGTEPGHVQELSLGMLAPEVILAALSFIIGISWISGVWHPILSAVNTGFGLGGN